jgi:hypothetical protein
MKLIFLLFIVSPLYTSAQKIEDTKIKIILIDTIDIYKKVKIALVNADFIVKDNYNFDTLTTYSREFTNMAGHCVIVAILKNNTVTLFGYYSLKRMNFIGLTQSSNDFQKIMYYKSSKSWDLLIQVAEGIEGKVSFDK